MPNGLNYNKYSMHTSFSAKKSHFVVQSLEKFLRLEGTIAEFFTPLIYGYYLLNCYRFGQLFIYWYSGYQSSCHESWHRISVTPWKKNLKSSLLVAAFTILGNYLNNNRSNTHLACGSILQYVQLEHMCVWNVDLGFQWLSKMWIWPAEELGGKLKFVFISH